MTSRALDVAGRNRWSTAALAVVLVAALSSCGGAGSHGYGGTPDAQSTGAAASGSARPVPVLPCPRGESFGGDKGPSSLAAGAVAARLCNQGAVQITAPLDVLTTGLTTLVSSVNAQKRGIEPCLGGRAGDRYVLLVAYPDGTDRQVQLSLSGCGSMSVGTASRLNPYQPYQAFMDLLREQRRTATPPSKVPAPTCLPQYSGFSPVADPAAMVAARLCVSYGDTGGTTSVSVPPTDLQQILKAWTDGPKTPVMKGPACGPTTPTWVLSGVTGWGDPVQITAECGRPTNNNDWVRFTPQAQQTVDRLVAQAGVQVNDGTSATTAWSLVQAWLSDVNARAVVRDVRRAAQIAQIAARMWVRDPWLPTGELRWDLLGASRTKESGWQQAWRIPARTPTGRVVFVVVRNTRDQPWRILSLTR